MTKKLKFDIYLSYSFENKDLVEELYKKIYGNGYILWFNKNKMAIGNQNKLIQNVIDESLVFLCCATTSYCKNENEIEELNYAIKKEKKIIYVLFENFKNKQDILEKLDKISFDLVHCLYYKHNDIKSIIKELEIFKKVSFKKLLHSKITISHVFSQLKNKT